VSQAQTRIVEEAPGQRPWRIVQEQVAGHEQQQRRDHDPVEAYFSPVFSAFSGFDVFSGGVIRAPHAHTMLRVAHWMFRRRPQAPQPT
jgi:hypothetical protein